MSKKQISVAFVCLATAVAAWATPRLIPVDTINALIVKILAPNQGANSQLAAIVKVAELDETRAIRFGGEVSVSKINKIAAAFHAKVNYSYPTTKGSVPEVKATLNVTSKDMAKMFENVGYATADVDKFFTDTQKAIAEMSSDALKEYGQAVSLETSVSNVKKDNGGHYLSETVQVHIAIDLAKLPAEQKPISVPLTDLNVLIDLDLSRGAEVAARVVMNPAYDSFRADQQGLKEILEKLEKNDKDTLQSIADLATMASRSMDTLTGKND